LGNDRVPSGTEAVTGTTTDPADERGGRSTYAHRPPRFFVAPEILQNDSISLSVPEARHARVRRLGVGDTVVVFDGRGNSRLADIVRMGRNDVELKLLRRLPDGSGESPLQLELAIALLKSEKLEEVIERTTQLGVNRFLPFASRNSLGRPSSARLARWHQIAIAAAKQCERTKIPRIEDPVDLETILCPASPLPVDRPGCQGETRARPTEILSEPAPCRLLLSESDTGNKTEASLGTKPTRIMLMVGPEGGFAPHEIAAAVSAGWHLITLGPRILRAETAAITAVALCQHRWGDLGRRPEP